MNQKEIYKDDSVLVIHSGNNLVFRHPTARISYGSIELMGFEAGGVWEAIFIEFSKKQENVTNVTSNVRPSKNQKQS